MIVWYSPNPKLRRPAKYPTDHVKRTEHTSERQGAVRDPGPDRARRQR
jgi:hypothetical protein